MNIIWKISCLLFLSCATTAQFNDFKITYSDMDNTVEKFVVGEALALSSENNTRVFLEKLIHILDTKYGKEWIGVFGNMTNIVGASFVKNTTLQFNYKATEFSIGRHQAQTVDNSNETIKSKIEQAINSPVFVHFTNNNTRVNELVVIAKKVLSHSDDKCNQLSHSGKIQDWCFYDLSNALLNEYTRLNRINKANYYTFATIGVKENYLTFSAPHGSIIAYEDHHFSLGDIYFNVRSVVS